MTDDRDPLIGPDGEPFIPDWVRPCWPQIKPALLAKLGELPPLQRDCIIGAIAAGPGALAFREIDGAVYVGAGTSETGFLVLEFDLLDVMPAQGEH